MKNFHKSGSGSKSSIKSNSNYDPRMNVFFDMAPDLFCIANPNGYFIKLNPAWETITGYTIKELTARPFVEFIHPDDVASTAQEVAEQLKGKETKCFNNRYRCKDKTYKYFEWRAKANEDGTELYAVARDVSERFKAEETLREIQEKYEAAFRMSPDAININKLDGTYVEINNGFTDLTGYTREDVIGVSSLEIDIWAIPEDRIKLIEELKIKRNVNNLESVFRCKNGSLKTALMSASLIKINNEPHILSVTRDITQRKQSEKALRDSEEKYRMLAVNSSDVIWTMNLKGEYMYVSPSVEQLRGYTVEETFLQGIEGTLTPESAATARKSFEEFIPLLMSGIRVPPQSFVLEQVCKDGSTVWTEMTISTLYNDEQQIIGFIGSSRNISERVQIQEKLKTSEAIFRSLAEYSPNMIFIIIKNKIYYVNQLCEKKLGYAKEELYAVNFDFDQLVADEHKKLLRENLHLFEMGKELEPFEFLMCDKHGRTLYTMVNGKCVQFGNENAILGVIMDISEQRWAEEMLKRKANQFEHFSKLMVDRELKMVELKIEVNQLLEKLGDKPRYEVA